MKILGIDYGKSKIGLAVGDTETGLVEPVKNFQWSMVNFQSIINDQKIQKIVLGIPGGKIEKEIKDFGLKIERTFGLPVEYFDETLTTRDAQRELLASGKTRKSRQKLEDAFAAAIMLELFMEGRSN